MKKNLLGIIAVSLGVALSAFTTINKKTPDLYYKDGGVFHPFDGEGCPSANEAQCVKFIEDIGNRPIYTQPNDLSPLMTWQ